LACVFDASHAGEDAAGADKDDVVTPGVALVPDKAFFPVPTQLDDSVFVKGVPTLFGVLDETFEIIRSLP